VAVGAAVKVSCGSVSTACVDWEVGASGSGETGDPARESPGFVADITGLVSSPGEGLAGGLSAWIVAAGRSFAASGGLLHEATQIKIRITGNQHLDRLGKFCFIPSFSTPSFSPSEFCGLSLYTARIQEVPFLNGFLCMVWAELPTPHTKYILTRAIVILCTFLGVIVVK
jgi:hypothetical protein